MLMSPWLSARASMCPFVQFMPMKPIKHGIKVCALCCSEAGYLCSFEACAGKGNTEDGSPRGVIGRLTRKAGLGRQMGRVLCADNCYTSLEAMKHAFVNYGMMMVGDLLTHQEEVSGGS